MLAFHTCILCSRNNIPSQLVYCLHFYSYITVRTRVCGVGSPCLLVNYKFAREHYSVGPPYILHKTDLLKIVDNWVDFLPRYDQVMQCDYCCAKLSIFLFPSILYRILEGYPHLVAEMFAYSMSAAHANLPHLQVEHLMISSPNANREGWQHIDQLKQACTPPDSRGIFYPNVELPNVLHYCQFYKATSKDLVFFKRKMPVDIFLCNSPMLEVPPAPWDLLEAANASSVSVRTIFGKIYIAINYWCVHK